MSIMQSRLDVRRLIDNANTTHCVPRYDSNSITFIFLLFYFYFFCLCLKFFTAFD